MVDLAASGATSSGAAGQPASPAADGPATADKYVCFRVSGQEYAIAIASVKETMMMVPITRVFLTPPWLAGIINLRGDIVAVLDLAQYLGLNTTAVTDRSRIIICRDRGRALGLVVDEMAELRTLAAAEIQPPPSTITGDSAAVLAGVATIAGGAVRILALTNLLESERLRAFQRKES
ncbi:MAG: chemotaxis protein CheW [Myxococcota bacterium]